MIINLALLLLAGLSGAFLLTKTVSWKQDNFKLALLFAGGYLFAITILHILPGLFLSGRDPFQIGIFILAGFFLQQLLEFLTAGVELGHFHVHNQEHQHKTSFGWTILIGLTIHSFLEGTMLSLPAANQIHASTHALLAGVILHKIPASLALSSVLLCSITNKKTAFILILLFALSSPFGLVVSNYAYAAVGESPFLLIILAIVTGNFLHISTTIVFESTAEHKFNFQRLLWSLMGAGIAVIAELIS